MNEIWLPIQDTDGMYEVSNLGKVRSWYVPRHNKKDVTPNILTPDYNSGGYMRVCIKINNNQKVVLVHRLVAETFLLNKEGKLTVNHKDGNKKNNTISNLEWHSYSENLNHAYITNLRPTGKENSLCQFGIVVIKDNIEINVLYGRKAITELGLTYSLVLKCLNGKSNHHKGYTFRKEPLT